MAPFDLNVPSLTVREDNGRVILPPGTTNHGNPNLLCLPTKWTDVAIFILGNYVAHAATIVLSPGSSLAFTCGGVVHAIFAPVSGAAGGYRAIHSWAIWAPTDLQKAARAGALCKVVRSEEYAQTDFERSLSVNSWFLGGKVQGRLHLPTGYCLAIVPRDATFIEDQTTPTRAIPFGYNMVQILISLAQLLFAIATIYRSRGDQLDRYGYAAFGLTVIPYAWMSLVNLLGNMIRPQYFSTYLVESAVMDEARQTPGAVFELVVGRLDENLQDTERDKAQSTAGSRNFTCHKLSLLPLAAIPTVATIIVIGILTGFKARSSTLTQRVCTMSWLAVGGLIGGAGTQVRHGHDDLQYRARARYKWVARILLFAAPAAGYVVVAQMLSEYGACMRLD